LANVKIQKTGNEPYVNHEEKSIVFPVESCNKIKNKSEIKIHLTESDYNLIEATLGEYLIKISTKDRCNGYSLLVSDISKKYLQQSYSNNSFRHLHSTYHLNDIDPDFIKKLQRFKEIARQQNHSLETLLENYIDEVIKV
jgi:hypothetical protein